VTSWNVCTGVRRRIFQTPSRLWRDSGRAPRSSGSGVYRTGSQGSCASWHRKLDTRTGVYYSQVCSMHGRGHRRGQTSARPPVSDTNKMWHSRWHRHADTDARMALHESSTRQQSIFCPMLQSPITTLSLAAQICTHTFVLFVSCLPWLTWPVGQSD